MLVVYRLYASCRILSFIVDGEKKCVVKITIFR